LIEPPRHVFTRIAQAFFALLLFCAVAVIAPAGVSSRTDESSTVTLITDDVASVFMTRARSVADFLSERNLVVGPSDVISAKDDDPIVDGMTIEYRSVHAHKVIADGRTISVTTAAHTTSDVLVEAKVSLGPNDETSPDRLSTLNAPTTIKVVRVRTWTEKLRARIAALALHRYSSALVPGSIRTISPGTPGIRETTVEHVRRDDGSPDGEIGHTQVVRAPQPAIIAHGINEYEAFSRLARRGFESTANLTGSALRMVATAYTANCAGCSGITKNGMHAGHGIVAVDPHVIPLGSKLFIPGYGQAVAGALAALKRACADSNVNVMPPLIDAVKALATEGEIIDAMVEVYGRYTEKAMI